MIFRVFHRNVQLLLKADAAKLAGIKDNQIVRCDQQYHELKMLASAFNFSQEIALY